MAYTDRRSNQKIRFKSGLIDIRLDGEVDWENLGKVEGGTLLKKSGQLKAGFMDGTSLKKRGEQECDLTLVLSQVNKDVLDRIDEILDSSCEVLIYNGKEGGVHQSFYIKEAEPMDDQDLALKGNEQQKVTLKFSVMPQDAVISVTPSTTFPATSPHIAVAVPVVGKNPYYTIIETDVVPAGDGPGDGPL